MYEQCMIVCIVCHLCSNKMNFKVYNEKSNKLNLGEQKLSFCLGARFVEFIYEN